MAFRFSVLYFGLYVVTTQMFGGMLALPFFRIPELAEQTPFRQVVFWVGEHIVRLDAPIPLQPTGSGDTLFNWVHALTLLLIAVSGTAIWTAVRRAGAHPRLFKWFRLFIRFALGSTMLSYGLVKVIPLQMPILSLQRLVEPFGNFSPMGVLWSSIGASPSYEIFTGCAEVFAALLLFLPRTTLAGAMLALMNSIAIFALNMTYDVPVKLFSFHLILMSLFLLAPEMSRLFRFYLGAAVGRSREPRLGGTPRAQRVAVIAQGTFGAYLLALGLYGSMQSWKTYGGGAPRPALFGIWEIQQMTVDGADRPPLLTDSTRWRRLIVQREGSAVFQLMNDSFSYYRATWDSTAATLTLTAREPTTFAVSRPTPTELRLSGELDGTQVHLVATLRDHESFELHSRKFHWIQEFPYNR